MDLLLKSSGLLSHQAKDLAHIMHFIRNLHNQKLQHYILGKNPTSVQNAITLIQKKDAELKIIEGLHSNDLDQEVHSINLSQTDKPVNPGSCDTCIGPHFIKDCKDTICLQCKPNLNKHTPLKCPRRCPSNWPFNHNTPHNTTTRNTCETDSYAEPNPQLSVSTNKPDQMSELLEIIKQMTKYFKRLLKHTPKHNNNNDYYQDKTNTYHSNKCKHKPHYHKDEVNKITLDTCTPKHTPKKINETPDNTDIDSSDSTVHSSSDSKWLSREHEIIEVKLSNSRYAANFPVKVNNNQTVSLFDTGPLISCISKSCFEKLDPKSLLIRKNPYRVNSTDGNTLRPLVQLPVP